MSALPNPEARTETLVLQGAENTEQPMIADTPVLLRDVPRLVAPIIDFIHEHRPEQIIAADRGARLAAMAIYWGYHQKYDVRLPTRGHRMDFLRLSKSTIDRDAAIEATRQKLCVSELLRLGGVSHEPAGPLRVLFVDDWVDKGTTASLFYDAAESAGYSDEELAFATLCGKRLTGRRHIVGDPTLGTRNSVWNAYEEITAVVPKEDTTSVRGIPSAQSQKARLALQTATRAYFAQDLLPEAA